MTMSRHRGAAGFAAVSLLVVSLMSASGARADGALAIGFPADVSKDGFAYGFSIDQANKDEAREAALKACRNTNAAPQSAKVLCMVVGTFSNECVSIAMDPKAGTPGVGFAIASNQETAEERALAFCAATEGADRRGNCKIDRSSCDKKQP